MRAGGEPRLHESGIAICVAPPDPRILQTPPARGHDRG